MKEFFVKDFFDFSGNVVFIIGLIKGIGKVMVEGFVVYGVKVVILSCKVDVCDVIMESICVVGGDVVVIFCNIFYKEEFENFVVKMCEYYGCIDMFILNVVVNFYYGFSFEILDFVFEKVMVVNIQLNYWFCQMVVFEMVECKDGFIVIVLLIGGFCGFVVFGVYVIFKVVDMQFVCNFVFEFGFYNICVNVVVLGLVKIDFVCVFWENDEVCKQWEVEMFLCCFGEFEDFVGVVVYFVLKVGVWMIGQIFIVDGGVMSC